MQPKRITLFKRGKRYYAKACFLGTVGTVSTGTDQLTLAQLIAPRLLAEKFANMRKTWTVSKVLKHHQKHAVHLRPRTIKMVQEFTRIYLAEIGLEHSALIQHAFTAKMANEFLRSRLARAKSADRTSISITANTILRMVKTLFTARMLETYDELPPEIEQFRKVRPLPVRHPQYSVADKKSKMARVIERCHTLENSEPGPYLAFWLMLYCGLRRAEVAASRWSWVTENGLFVQCDETFQTKSGQSRLVPLSEPQIAHLRSFQHPGAYILRGSFTTRYRTHIDRIGKIIREAGFTGSKSVHELRKYFGANVATQLGLFAAQKYLGHHSPDVTSRYYADLIESKPVEIKIL